MRLEETLDNILELIKTIESNYDLEIDSMTKIMRMHIRANIDHPESPKMANMMTEIRKLNRKQLSISKSIFNNF